MLTYLLALVNPASVGQQVFAVAFLISVDWSPLCPALISWLTFSWLLSPANFPWDLPSLVLLRSRGRSRAQALCVSFAPKQTKRSSDWFPHPQKRMPPIVSHRFNICIKHDLALNNLHKLICHKTEPTFFFIKLKPVLGRTDILYISFTSRILRTVSAGLLSSFKKGFKIVRISVFVKY